MAPEGWDELPLGEVVHITGGGTPSKGEPSYWNGDVPWATPTDVTGLKGRTISDTTSTITRAGLRESSAALLPRGSLLLTTRATLGECAITTVEMATNQGFQSLVPRGQTCVEFLYYLIQCNKRRLGRLAAGSTFREISKASLRSLRFAFPSLPEQRRIAAVLSSVDDAIEKTQSAIAQVEVVKRALMQELLTRGLPGRHTRFKKTGTGEVPEEWTFLPLGALAASDRGLQTGPFGSQLHASDYVANGVPVVMPKDMTHGYVSHESPARVPYGKAEELSRHRVQVGDLLFARRGDLGRVGLISRREEGWLCGTGCIRFRPRNPAVSRYLRQWMASPPTLRWLNENAVGQTMLNLNTAILSCLPVALPAESERSLIVDALEAPEAQVGALKGKVEGLRRTKKALMSVLLTGELRVTPDPEPA